MAIDFLKEPEHRKKPPVCKHELLRIREDNGDIFIQCENPNCMQRWKDYIHEFSLLKEDEANGGIQ